MNSTMWCRFLIFVLFSLSAVVCENEYKIRGSVGISDGNTNNQGTNYSFREVKTKIIEKSEKDMDSLGNKQLENQKSKTLNYETNTSNKKEYSLMASENEKVPFNGKQKLMNEGDTEHNSRPNSEKENTMLSEQILNLNTKKEQIILPKDFLNKTLTESVTVPRLPNNEGLKPNVTSEGQEIISKENTQKTILSYDKTEFNKKENEPITTSEDSAKTRKEEEEKDVCFPHLGCFSMGKPWKSLLRPVSAPHSPEKIATTLFFYSRENLNKQKNISLYPQIDMGEASFDPRKLTAVIVHGFANSGNATWMKDMKNAYLKQVDANVILVDWGKGANLLNYLQVAGNTRVVGKQLGMFVDFLKKQYGADPGKFHLIGHSLGAQICSYLAKYVSGIARLTALDPAQPAFEGFAKEVRLDSSDAEFVDVIHTDARPFIPTLGFGMITPHGHVDLYINGGFDQPGCISPPKKELPAINNILDLAKYPVEVIAKVVACPHGRAYEYLIESFNETEKCIFWGHKADVSNVFKTITNTVTQGLLKKYVALSTTCSKENCIPMGFATKKSSLRGIFVVTTSGREPYCISEPGIPPETLEPNGYRESFIQKIAKKVRPVG